MAKHDKHNSESKHNGKQIVREKVAPPIKLGVNSKLAVENKLSAGQQVDTKTNKIVKPVDPIQPHLASAYTVINVSKNKKSNSNVECILIAICTEKQKPWETHDFGKRIGAETALSQLKRFLLVNR